MNTARRCPEGKENASVFTGDGVDEPDCRVLVLVLGLVLGVVLGLGLGLSVFLMTLLTRQFKKVPTLALALNCSCSALEFK